MSIEIEKAEGGYILTARFGFGKHIFTDTESLFDYLLQWCEGRSESFGGDIYGKVTIQRERP